MTPGTTNIKYLIIGNSAGGIGAAEAIREADQAGTIAIVSDEPYPAYSRPLIAEYLAEKCSLEKMLYRPADFYPKNHISTVLGVKVRQLDVTEHTARLENGESITWGKLLLATGGAPIVPPMKGHKKKGIFTFTTLDDAKAIDRYLDKVSNVVVIGGGLIGVSVTEALVKRDMKVAIVEMKDRLLNTILDEEASAIAEAALKQAGVQIIVNHTVTEITHDVLNAASGVTLDNEDVVPCQMVIVAIGVRPRLDITSGTEIRVNHGIVVDRFMATSIPDIYACGDVAEAHDFVYGENRVTPIWPNAYLGGRVAGFNMAGVPTEYYGGASMNSLKYFGLAITSAGIVSPPDDDYELLVRKDGPIYRKIVLKDGRVVGMVFAGNIERSGIVLNLMRERVDTASFKGELVASEFGLASLPEAIWRPRIEAPAK